ncbi:hypothetical protein WCP94_003253 [Bilophila wadsworthia]
MLVHSINQAAIERERITEKLEGLFDGFRIGLSGGEETGNGQEEPIIREARHNTTPSKRFSKKREAYLLKGAAAFYSYIQPVDSSLSSTNHVFSYLYVQINIILPRHLFLSTYNAIRNILPPGGGNFHSGWVPARKTGACPCRAARLCFPDGSSRRIADARDALRFRDNGYGTDKEPNIEISHRNILF